jgi:hypothetical protein
MQKRTKYQTSRERAARMEQVAEAALDQEGAK